MEHCIVDLGIINYHPVITWTVPVAFFFLVVLAGIVFNIGRKSNLIVFIGNVAPSNNGFHFYVTGR